MSIFALLGILALGIGALLFLILYVRLPAFLALLFMALLIGLAAGMSPMDAIDAMEKGMGGTLGFVAVVVGLGAMFGALLEASGGIRAVSDSLLRVFGDRRASWALGLVGFLVAIPVFFDVAFIMLVPLIHKLSKQSGRALLVYALPLLAGLAVTHAFIPPTPGPIAVASVLGADLGWVIVFGALAGLPAMILAGPVFARFFEGGPVSTEPEAEELVTHGVSFWHAIFAILLPLFLIVGATVSKVFFEPDHIFNFKFLRLFPIEFEASLLQTIGHPFIALMIACLYAYIAFGRAKGIAKDKLLKIMNRALEPAGVVILITGAGGVLKQVMVDSEIGKTLATAMIDNSIPIILFAFATAAIVRIAQGSATAAMLAAAGLTAPVLAALDAPLSAPQTAIIVIAIASGASLMSHVNDSGFWLVNRYLGQTEAETLRSWTVASTIVGVTGFVVACIAMAVV